jgi:hypothetical protein
MSNKKLRIAWFYDQNPNSLSYYCNQLLLPKLKEVLDIQIFVSSPKDFTEHHYVTCYRIHKESPFDLFFYQLEDIKSARFVRMHLGLMPGVVWVHDVYLQDQGPEGLLVSPWERTISQYWDQKQGFLDRKIPPHQLFPRAIREMSLSPALLFSSEWGLREYKNFISQKIETFPGSQITEYLPVPVQGKNFSRLSAREKFVRIASVSPVGVEGRAYKLFAALSELKENWQLTWLINSADRAKAFSLIEEFKVNDKVRIEEGVSPEAWIKILERSDVALHMNRSAFGHLSPYLPISLTIGVPVVVTDSVEGAAIPNDLVFRVKPGLFEAAEFKALFEHLIETSCEHHQNRTVEYAKKYDIDNVSSKLIEFLNRASFPVGKCIKQWTDLQSRARQSLFDEVLQINSAGEDYLAFQESMIANTARDLGW